MKAGDWIKIKPSTELIKLGWEKTEAAELSEKICKVNCVKDDKIVVSILNQTKEYIVRERDFIVVDESKEEPSVKNDIKDNKVMMQLLPFDILYEIAKVFTVGAKKYGPNKWRNLPDGYERFKGAALRHLTEVEKGNRYDEETGCDHITQFAWNALVMVYYKLRDYALGKK